MRQKIYKELQELALEMDLSVRDTIIDVLYYFYIEVGYDDETIYNMLEAKADDELFEEFYANHKEDKPL